MGFLTMNMVFSWNLATVSIGRIRKLPTKIRLLILMKAYQDLNVREGLSARNC